jgi:hypothetical protein
MTETERKQVDAFAAEWLSREGYQPAPFQKAIALQRFRRGETADEIIAALIAQQT